jgi:hypothetical protein
MNAMKDKIIKIVCRSMDLLLVPLTLITARFCRLLRRKHFVHFPVSKRIFFNAGVYPILDHYYDPLFNIKHIKKPLDQERNLPAIDFNIAEQLDLLVKFNYNDEMMKFPVTPAEKKQEIEYCYTNHAFKSGDAEYLYNMIRLFKPSRIFEIGSGSSTLMAINATKQNRREDPEYNCEHICIEPFENNWLESLGIIIKRDLVENINVSFFQQLNANDILFIDSSHIIRPQGDVLFEYLEILPTLRSGVLVHVHDIFTPRDYLKKFLEIPYLWNEQYLLEAYLSSNKEYRIVGATNFLRHNHYEAFSSKCPVLKMEIENGIEREPGSFWIIKN